MVRKKKRIMIEQLGRLAAIQSDYVRAPESQVAAQLLCDISKEIAGKKGQMQMLDYAMACQQLRHNDIAKNSSPIVGGDSHEKHI